MNTDTKKITLEQFDTAVTAAIADYVSDPTLDGPARFMLPMTGIMFAGKLHDKLFGKNDGETNPPPAEITGKQFDESVMETIGEFVNDPALDGEALFVVPLSCTLFARRMRRKLLLDPEREASSDDSTLKNTGEA